MKFVLFIFIFILIVLIVHSQNDRVPAVPLVVKSPYLTTWISSQSKHLFGDWPQFWSGKSAKGLSGIIKVDGNAYEFMGHPTQDVIGTKLQVVQKGLKITPTQSIFTLEAGPVELKVNFFTPIDPTDLKLMSIPGSYITISVKSTDSAKHKIEIYVDISAEWVGGNRFETATWSFNSKVSDGKVFNFDVQLQNQKVFEEFEEQAEWGTIKFFTTSGSTYQTGDAITVRSDFVRKGKLNNQVDVMFRQIIKGWPVFGYSHELGEVDGKEVEIHFGIAHVRHPAIQYTNSTLNSLWESYFSNDSNILIAFMHNDRAKALERAQTLDNKILKDANKVGGESYAKIVSAALRQAFGGTELVGTPDKPWLLLKEISSDGNCQTADVIYPHFPVLYYLNPHLIKLELDPLFENMESGFWPKPFAMHDMGSSYPRCIGHKDGGSATMEVEESANMIIITAAYLKASNNTEYVKKHYKILKQWSQYLVDHGLFTGNTMTTDDFLGPMKNSTNLSIKAIISLSVMSNIATINGNTGDAKRFSDVAHSYAVQWENHAQNSDKSHLKTSYNDVDSSWFLLYNFYADKLLNTNIVPQNVYKEQDEWYLKVFNKYGLKLISKDIFTKNDWEMFYAAATHDQRVKQMLFDKTALWLNETRSTAPFPDWVHIENGDTNFLNRPVVGAVFAPLTVN